MILKILGCGTSTGVPIPGCSCAVCNSSDAKNSRDRTSALIKLDSINLDNINLDNGDTILIDASPDLRQQALKWGIKKINAVLFTHSHADHIFGLDDLRGFNFVLNAPIPCYATASTLGEIQKRFSYIFDIREKYEGGGLPRIELHEIVNGQPFTILGVKIEPLAVVHGTMEVTGFKVGNIAYLTDCSFIPDESKAVLKGISTLVIDGLRYKKHKTHFTISEAIAVAQELSAERTYLTHMCHSVDYETVSAQLPEGIFLAYDGLEISFTP